MSAGCYFGCTTGSVGAGGRVTCDACGADLGVDNGPEGLGCVVVLIAFVGAVAALGTAVGGWI